MNIAIDVMGGDYAPEAVVDGILLAISNLAQEETILAVGPADTINTLLADRGYTGSQIRVINADQVIEMGEHPTRALSQKPNSSIGVGFALLKEGKADIFASAGNTGAMMVGSLFSVKTIEGVQRPAIAGFIPQTDGTHSVMLDIGANADCKPEMLEQWAVLGSVYASATRGIASPRVGLLNIGEEEQKGSILALATHALLKANDKLNFVGNLEGKDVFRGKADVIVTDGFTGNIVLKMGESIYNIMKEQGMVNEFVDRTNYENYGGSPIIGINGNVIIAHGASSPTAIMNMIKLCQNIVKSEVAQKIKAAFENN
ncbi:phosphate acyltransferase PlsX [Aquirufa sp. LEPPI-3A]|uniref:phosphate acyltransferase PlsX n=1 Tax=Aquirufa regiilacus TaxID=3024868 RepID=UPI0028E045F0|nr:phosphate acyltransferase PlsX [Aquirufa sp. LEPPI-3A]MDT8887729.1 phosphate acyltransferase PlsX [Aquirufa sp. LEPPI-3A]